MFRYSLTGTVLLGGLLLVGCGDSPTILQQKADAQHEADQKIADAKQDASQAIRDAQSEANRKKAAADADFAKEREDYRHNMATQMTDLDKRTADLEAQAMKANGKMRADLTARVKEARSSRETFERDYSAIDNATASSWPELKARLDREWAEVRTRLNVD